MKKVSLATILVLSIAGVGLFAQAQTNQVGGYQDPNQPQLMQSTNSQAGLRHGERSGKHQYKWMGGHRGSHNMSGEPQCGAFHDRYQQGNILHG